MISLGETASTDRWRGPRFVQPLLAQTSEAHRDLLFRNLYSGGILSAGDVAADVSHPQPRMLREVLRTTQQFPRLPATASTSES